MVEVLPLIFTICFSPMYLMFLIYFLTLNKFIIDKIYRLPNSNIHYFFLSINEIVSSISTLWIPVHIMGHFNINILKFNEENVQNLVNVFHSHSLFFPTINKPTHVTRNSGTIIDHIWTNSFDNYLASEILYT